MKSQLQEATRGLILVFELVRKGKYMQTETSWWAKGFPRTGYVQLWGTAVPVSPPGPALLEQLWVLGVGMETGTGHCCPEPRAGPGSVLCP